MKKSSTERRDGCLLNSLRRVLCARLTDNDKIQMTMTIKTAFAATALSLLSCLARSFARKRFCTGAICHGGAKLSKGREGAEAGRSMKAK